MEGEGRLREQELNLEPRIRERLTGLGHKSGVYVVEDEETTATTKWGEEDAEAKRPNRDKVLLNELFNARSSCRRTNLEGIYKHAFVQGEEAVQMGESVDEYVTELKALLLKRREKGDLGIISLLNLHPPKTLFPDLKAT